MAFAFFRELRAPTRFNSISGLYHYSDGASPGRFYDPVIGRFIQPDNIVPDPGSQSWNPYAYVNNNPLRSTDPTGHCLAHDAAGGAAGSICAGILILGSMAAQVTNSAAAAVVNAASAVNSAAIGFQAGGGAHQLDQIATGMEEAGRLLEEARRAGQSGQRTARSNNSGEANPNGNPNGNPNDPLRQLADQAQRAYDAARAYNYRGEYFANNPTLRKFSGNIVVHHRVPLEALKKRPGLFTGDELNKAANLRGIPSYLNNDLHLREIHAHRWNTFWAQFPNATREQILQFAQQLDDEFDLVNLAVNEFLR